MRTPHKNRFENLLRSDIDLDIVVFCIASYKHQKLLEIYGGMEGWRDGGIDMLLH